MTGHRAGLPSPTVTGFGARQAIAELQRRGVATAALLHRAGLSETHIAAGSTGRPILETNPPWGELNDRSLV
jgi:hypothetical protein